ncbi:3-ketoacyl-ACP reductase [Acetobacter cibinongensis]|uniref:3-ketoacyl-ACP reductase n=1 Tax=Acetobacter cibinongensis TaxID=146475 RepID=A0A1Z5YX56_9PROT|nr:3-ketoacyl-ACP reductase [Acetobacter cibinongensis]OUJ03916.1 3-ketoacyl-ACP reductase [Acetobacter cibinongensis]
MTQVALVTGASRGIGLAVAEALAKEGFSLAVNGLNDDEELAAAVRHLSSFGVPVMPLPFDVAKQEYHSDVFAKIENELGPVTTLVNNAGVGVMQRGDMLDVTAESWDRCFVVNAKAVFFLSQAFARYVLARPRVVDAFYAVVTITSSNAVAVATARSEYCASKAAAAMVSKTLAVRLGPENIAVYDVQPGLIATEMTAPVIEQYRKRAADGLTLFPRVGSAVEIGRIVATLARGDLPYTTGQVIAADAGMLVPRF